jgi:hypothetical protein
MLAIASSMTPDRAKKPKYATNTRYFYPGVAVLCRWRLPGAIEKGD